MVLQAFSQLSTLYMFVIRVKRASCNHGNICVSDITLPRLSQFVLFWNLRDRIITWVNWPFKNQLCKLCTHSQSFAYLHSLTHTSTQIILRGTMVTIRYFSTVSQPWSVCTHTRAHPQCGNQPHLPLSALLATCLRFAFAFIPLLDNV